MASAGTAGVGSDWFFPPPAGQTNHIVTAVSKIQESKLLFKAHLKPLFPDSPTATVSQSTMGEKHKVTWQRRMDTKKN